MTLQELLKDKPDVLKEVEASIQDSDVKFVDLKEGNYVDKKKYDDLNTDYENLKNEPNPLEATVEQLKKDNETNIETEKNKLAAFAKNISIDKAVNELGVSDKLTLEGIKSLIDRDKLTVDDNYIVSGLDEQLKDIKKNYKDSFVQPTVVSTGQVVSNSSKNKQSKVYSAAEIDKMSVTEIMENIGDVNASLGNV
jgi:hypothetical protein